MTLARFTRVALAALRLAATGREDIWTVANPSQTHRLQPFGGRLPEKGRHGGFLIPTRVEMGNKCGTSDFAPFFLSTLTSAVV